ncbi:putative bifunctional diguanylate cyclase/phosphodiesterase [Marinobacter changyiensis]|uniref:putative bifunctional diguanylate cyclase/phosphodiesterase n=1 Tax=Marinobacter changyiensis TaxID=2604091 RepID=UPI00126421A4|nr:EAL domain-containing protein [Marinobacter changyiensis]
MNKPLTKPGFRGRLMLAMLTVVVVTSVSIAGVMLVYLFEEEKTRAARQLDVAGGIAKEVIDRRNELLISNLRVIVEDFGFKSAIASRDTPTITSALANHTARAGTNLAMLADNQGDLIANLQGLENGSQMPFGRVLSAARERGFATEIVSWRDRAYQVLIVPIQGPGLRAWLAAGFPLDNEFADFIGGLTGTDVVFKRRDGNRATILASSLPGDAMETGVLEQFDLMNDSDLMESRRYFVKSLTLRDAPDSTITALLLSDRATALETYYQLAFDMALLVIAALAIAGLLVLITARALGRPVLELAHFAAAIGNNPAAEPPDLKTSGELNTLCNALTEMRLRIREREHRIRHHALHDDLTGLPNRKAVEQVLLQWFQQRQPGYLIGFSLTDFKALNDTLGFGIGDQAILATGLRLRGQVPPDCPFGRTGGNEFIALLQGEDEIQLRKQLTRLRSHAELPVVIRDTPINLQIHIAVLRVPEDARTLDEVRRRLGLTLERARKTDNRIAFYEPGGDELHLRELRLIRDLAGARQSGELFMNYQPKIRFEQVRFTQVEALIRWKHPELGFINPEEFIALAERSGQIHELTHFILKRIAADAQQWHQAGLNIGVAINLSALDLADRNLPGDVLAVFDQWRGRMDQLTFEITESVLMHDADTAIQTLEKLKALGVKLSVDDFGTGYSSLTQLRQLPVHELKIDKSFVLNLDTQPQDQLIVKSTIDMAHGLGLSVVAEGIENSESWHLLQSWGCDLAQGFFLGRPMDADAIAQWADEFTARVADLRPALNPLPELYK